MRLSSLTGSSGGGLGGSWSKVPGGCRGISGLAGGLPNWRRQRIPSAILEADGAVPLEPADRRQGL